jgi:iron complex transport system ATP-binding protein
MLSARDLAFGYRGRPVGRRVTMTVSPVKVLCLLGPNGCGKTTLFRTLLGLLPPLGGQLEFRGKPVQSFGRAEFARHVAYVPQANSAYFPFQVSEMVTMARASRIGVFATPSFKDREMARSALERLNLGHLADRTFTTLSGGERQMVLIARALAQEAELIVMDEPTASLDFGNQTRVLDCINELRRSGLAIVLSTHDPGHAFACADEVALMKEGQIIGFGPPPTAVTAATLKQLYGVEVAVEFMPAADRSICAPVLGNTQRQG